MLNLQKIKSIQIRSDNWRKPNLDISLVLNQPDKQYIQNFWDEEKQRNDAGYSTKSWTSFWLKKLQAG